MNVLQRNKINILDHTWFVENIGIVLIELEITKERKAYIKTVSGFDIDTDIKAIVEWGASFPLNAAYELFPRFKPQIVSRETI